jgi:hypothetical protein
VVSAVLEAFFFMLDDLAVELVDQDVNRSVHVQVVAFDEYIFAAQMNVGLDFLFELFHRKYNADIDYMIEMARDAVQLSGDVVAYGGRYLEMVAAKMKIHGLAPRLLIVIGGGRSARARLRLLP